MDDDELKLIDAMLSLIRSAEHASDFLNPVAIARAVEYVAERCYAERDAYERDLAEEEREEAEEFLTLAKSQIAAHLEQAKSIMAQMAGCDCADCQRARGERFDA